MNTHTALIYAGVGALIGGLTEIAQIAITVSTNPITSVSHWLISAVVGVVSASALAAIPWLKAILPAPPPNG